ncbi:trypsin-like peptidase domain-containing protein [Pseudaminobacter sp. 19-2017]|uniref:Trypsin-like peptidase domain-containing protein n=1 Tax=Pseudaminobacter soli (ex Zhang et al. 2022) TaxID=2831468 RepID=A0A942E0X6_9HYPH|nr:serine protease [Pseudaminobacter soli]MBS3648585.1 trypsin-like peptidase domain-containing protein [Pseudaminobacter soli]
MDASSQVRAKSRTVALILSLIFLSLGWDTPSAEAQGSPCVDPSQLASSVVSIAWYFEEPRPAGTPAKDIVGERATAWLYTSPRLLVTAAHFASDLLAKAWQEAELTQAAAGGRPERTIRVRIRVADQVRVPGPGEDSRAGWPTDVAILELENPFPDAQALALEPTRPAKDTTVLVLGYPDGQMRAARAIVRETDDPADELAGLALVEVEGPNRLLFNAGASGSPVVDCRKGRVVAVLNGLLTARALPFLPQEYSVIPTPWGSPTNTAVPASALAALGSAAPELPTSQLTSVFALTLERQLSPLE